MSVREIINVYLCPKNSRLVMEWNIKIVAWFDVSPLSCSFRLITFHLIGNIFDCPFFLHCNFFCAPFCFLLVAANEKFTFHCSIRHLTFGSGSSIENEVQFFHSLRFSVFSFRSLYFLAFGFQNSDNWQRRHCCCSYCLSSHLSLFVCRFCHLPPFLLPLVLLAPRNKSVYGPFACCTV